MVLTGKTMAKTLKKTSEPLATELKEKRYKAKLVRRRYIPKSGGKKRPLGIPVISDKLVQTAAAQILSAIYEQDFLPCSHGYRRGKGPQKAALELSKRLHRGRFRWIFDADIKGFFDNIDHDWLLRMLEQRIDDQAFLGLIRKWLKAGILEEDAQVILPANRHPARRCHLRRSGQHLLALCAWTCGSRRSSSHDVKAMQC